MNFSMFNEMGVELGGASGDQHELGTCGTITPMNERYNRILVLTTPGHNISLWAAFTKSLAGEMRSRSVPTPFCSLGDKKKIL